MAKALKLSARMVLRTVLAKAMDWEAPTMRNSNLLPVKAKGLVRLRSIQASVMVQMARRQVLPAVSRHLGETAAQVRG